MVQRIAFIASPEPSRHPCKAPCQYHLDGSWYQHRLFCPQQAIIICVILTESRQMGRLRL